LWPQARRRRARLLCVGSVWLVRGVGEYRHHSRRCARTAVR
jgi:hypothetical protein